MKTVNSLSGGQTSSYIAANYEADHNVFALVTTLDKSCQFPDKKIRQIVSQRINKEFIGTLEDNMIVYTMLDLEQFIGKKIDWVSGLSFDEIININGFKYLPNVTQRFCTTEMKLKPIYNWWKNNFTEPVEMRIGYRHNEQSRAVKMNSKMIDGFITFKDIIGKSKSGNRNKWGEIPWQKPVFPLIDNCINKDKIVEYWKDKPVRFAYMNNCIGCFHRPEPLLKFMSTIQPEKYDWFCRQESIGYENRTFKNGITYDKIRKHNLQFKLDFSDFSECDSGYCEL